MRYFYLFSLFFLISPFGLWSQDETEPTTQESIDILKDELSSTSITKQERIEKLHQIGQLYFDQPDSTAYFLNTALHLSKEIQDSVLISDTYINLSLVDLFKGNYDNTVKYTDSAIQFLNNRNGKHFLNLGIASTVQGIAYNNNEHMDLAFEKILNANSFLRKAPIDEVSQNYLVQNYSDLSLIYLNIEEYDNAIESAKQALLRAKPIEAKHHIADIYNTLASAYTKKEEYALATVYMDSSAQTFREIDFAAGLMRVFSDKGQLLIQEGKYSSAKAEFLQALALSRSLENEQFLTSNYLDLTTAYFKNDEIAMARIYLDSAETLSQQLNIPLFTNRVAIAKSQLLGLENNYMEAINILKQNVTYMRSENLRESVRDVYDELYQLYKNAGDVENSFLYYQKYSMLKDSLKQELQNSKLNVLRVEHNYSQVVADLENSETQLQLASEAQKRVKHRNYYLGGLAALIVLFSLFMFFRQRKLSSVRRAVFESQQEVLKVKQEALDNQVRFKNKQITDFAIHISEKNDLLENIKSKLKSIKVTNDTYKEMVKDTMHFINNDIEQNKEKIQLYKQVNETNDSFRAKIDQLYQNLSDKEKKVATMLRLGQTSKQIALQLNISAASVDNYRYTLRKKMNIPKGKSLKMFIQNI
jgi:DNA-binding CsgD family transcriptional regulator/tetratricopeptide (TPR) repeat protein